MEIDNEEDETVDLSIETTLSKQRRLECRQIVQEIKNFGIGQRQVLYLIQLLAFELENREVMLSILSAVKTNREEIKDNIIEIPTGND